MNTEHSGPSSGINIQHSTVDSSAFATGAGASAQVTVAREGGDPASQQILMLISRLRADLDALHEVDARTAVAVAQASGQLTALEAEVRREPRRREHLTGMLDGIATTVGGMTAVSETVNALVAVVGRLLG
jgi:hypothetical protein